MELNVAQCKGSTLIRRAVQLNPQRFCYVCALPHHITRHGPTNDSPEPHTTPLGAGHHQQPADSAAYLTPIAFHKQSLQVLTPGVSTNCGQSVTQPRGALLIHAGNGGTQVLTTRPRGLLLRGFLVLFYPPPSRSHQVRAMFLRRASALRSCGARRRTARGRGVRRSGVRKRGARSRGAQKASEEWRGTPRRTRGLNGCAHDLHKPGKPSRAARFYPQ